MAHAVHMQSNMTADPLQLLPHWSLKFRTFIPRAEQQQQQCYYEAAAGNNGAQMRH